MKIPSCLLWSLSVALVAAAASAQEPTPATKAVPAQKIVPMAAKPGAAAGMKLLETGATAPDFVSNDPSSQPVRLASLKGKVVVLDFWATWCGPCQKSLPHTQAVAKKFKDQGLVVLACCTSDTRAKFDEWVKTSQATYPDIKFTCDPCERGSANYDDRASKKLYGVAGIPTQFIIGRDGKIAGVLVGYSDGDVRLEACLATAGVK